jgi:hypothetical protein
LPLFFYLRFTDFRFSILLALDATVGITTGERFHFVNTYQVEVAVDGVLQGTGSYGKLKGLALGRLGEQTMNQTTGEGVTTTYAVNDRIDFVTL